MTQVAKPSHLDGKVLSVELTKQFPEVPHGIIMDIMEKNSNNRELCFEALNRECQKYQHHLYGVSSSDEKSQDGWQDDNESFSIILPQLEASFSDNTVVASRFHQENPVVYRPPHSTYTPPLVSVSKVSMPVVDTVTRQQSVVSPVSCPQPPIVFGVRDQKLYPTGSYQVMSGASVAGESSVGAFADNPQNIELDYALFRPPSLMVDPLRSGRARSPLPTPGSCHLVYPSEPFQNMPSFPFPFDRSPSGSCSGASIGLPFHNQPDVLVGPQSTSRACQPDAQLNGPANARSSRSGSAAAEDLTYIQALLIYQKARLDAFLVDLNQQKETLEVLRSEVGQLQKQSLDRRLSRNDAFPTAVDQQKLLTENLNLQVEIRLLTYEIDLANNGQTRLGWLDSEADQRFHDVIPSGQFNPFWRVTASQLHPQSYSSTPVVSLPGQPSVINNRVSLPLRPTRPPPPPPSFAAAKSTDPDDGESWSCSACTFLNHPLLNKCECCEMPKIPTGPSALR